VLDDLVHRAFDAFNRRDLDGLLAMLAPDVRVHSLMTEAEREDYHGHEGVREWHAAVFEIFPDWRPLAREIRELGDGAVIVVFDVTATAAGSGARIEQSYWQAARVRDGLIEFFGFYRSEEDAREALGLSRRE
jgi:ketosteroid isomerase-like protein